MTDEVFDQEVELEEPKRTYSQEDVQKVRREAAKYRTQKKALMVEKERLEAIVEAHEAGQEHPQIIEMRARAEAAEAAISELDRQRAAHELKEKVQKEARRLGALDGDAVFKLMDLEADDLEMEIRRTLDKHPVLIDKKAGPPLPLGPYNVSAEDLKKLSGDGGK